MSVAEQNKDETVADKAVKFVLNILIATSFLAVFILLTVFLGAFLGTFLAPEAPVVGNVIALFITSILATAVIIQTGE